MKDCVELAGGRLRWAANNLDLVTLKIFMTAAEEHSFAAAAIRENIALSSVSRRISDLELRIGVSLFQRHDRGVTLTSSGEALLSQTSRLFDLVELIAIDLDALKGGARGLIRLHAHMSATLGPLPDRIAAFRRSNPDIHIQITEQTSSEIVHAVSTGTADVGLISGTVATEGLHSVLWHEDRLAVVLPAGHPLESRDDIRLSDLADQPFVGLQKDSALLQLYRQHMLASGRVLIERAHTSSFESARHLVAAGLGVAILPLAAIPPEDVRITHRPLAEEWAKRPLKLCVRSPARLTAAARRFVQHLSIPPSPGKQG